MAEAIVREKYWEIEAVAEMLSCSTDHIRRLLREGQIEGIKIGGRAVRISDKSLQGFIEKNKINPEDYFDLEEEKVPPPAQPVARSSWMTKK